MALRNAFDDLALDDSVLALDATLRRRYGVPGAPKLPATAAYTTAGDHTLITPPPGQRIRLFYVQIIPSSDNEFANEVIVKFASGVNIYRSYVIGHWELFEGLTDEALIVNTQNEQKVSVTVHYELF